MPRLNADQILRLKKKRTNVDEKEKPKMSKKEEDKKAKEDELEQRQLEHRQRLTWQPAAQQPNAPIVPDPEPGKF